MKRNRAARWLFFLMLGTLLLRCANRIPPSGGAKDITPPLLLHTQPKNESLHFDGGTVLFVFDEHIREKSLQSNIVITPSVASEELAFKVLGKKLHITFKGSLKENTTYTINLDDCLSDVTEGNAVKDIKYVFSTGEHIDSLSVAGFVQDVLVQQPMADVSVVLSYAGDNTPLLERTFPYHARSNESGIFTFTHLKEGDYELYAFLDEDRNKRINPVSEKHGFIKETLRVHNDIKDLTVLLYEVDSRKIEKVRERPYKRYYEVLYNKTLRDYQVLPSTDEDAEPNLPHHLIGNKIRFYPNFTEELRPMTTNNREYILSVSDLTNNHRQDTIRINSVPTAPMEAFFLTIAIDAIHEGANEIAFSFLFNKPREGSKGEQDNSHQRRSGRQNKRKKLFKYKEEILE